MKISHLHVAKCASLKSNAECNCDGYEVMDIINLQDHSHRSASKEVEYDKANYGWAVFEVEGLGYYPAWWDDRAAYGWRALSGFFETQSEAEAVARENARTGCSLWPTDKSV